MIEEILEDPTCVFMFPTPEKLSPPLLKIEEGDFGYTENKDYEEIQGKYSNIYSFIIILLHIRYV